MSAAPPGADSGADWGAAMARGDYAGAFGISDAVLRARDPAGRDDPALPYHLRWVWDGRRFAGRRVVVRCYHGLGDTLQFCRYLPALRRVAAHVTLEVQPALLGVLAGLAGVDRLHGFDPARPLAPGDCDIEIMELAHALRLAPEPGAYLWAAARPGVAGRVGFCWQAGGWNPARSVPVAALAPLLAIPGLSAVSLQRGAAASVGVDPLGGSMDVAAMAGLVAGLAAVVTVDTMIAHLAGALGRPVFLLLQHEADWRWGRPGAWYGSVRQYRQACPGDWDSAVRALGADLAGTLLDGGGL